MLVPHHSIFLQAGCPSCCPTNSVKALKEVVVLRISDQASIPPRPSYNVKILKHAIHSDTQNTYIPVHKNESELSEMGPVRQNPIERTVCALHRAQLLHTILHRTDPIIFPLTLQTITVPPIMSI